MQACIVNFPCLKCSLYSIRLNGKFIVFPGQKTLDRGNNVENLHENLSLRKKKNEIFR